MEPAESHAPAGQMVYMGGGDVSSVASQIGISQVIRHQQKDVGPGILCPLMLCL
jgi:hypothetical protein